MLQEPYVRLGARMSGSMARMTDLWPGCPARRIQISFGAEIFELGAKLMGFRGCIVGKSGDMLHPLKTKQIHGSKSTKLRQTNKSQKKLGVIFGGDCRI